ncbi:hypothetical protein [Vibrio sp. THAF190c]|uniref:hypothetical protein n=1 Tax=Vibrio sp. THAF190c TaxID=2587865 RepID=UPI00126869D5|nr:hypothetical protein [Vibrio sp. THAF190c]QFT13514.1 hypothetical protein FIV04_26525 [Vibrio sp. THAF190c]
MKKIHIAIIIALAPFKAISEPKIDAYKAPFYVGETVMACGTVKQVSAKKQANFLNLDEQYPNQTLTLLIWNNNLDTFTKRFGDLNYLKGHRVCARGKITEYKGSLQIKLTNAQFLRLMRK